MTAATPGQVAFEAREALRVAIVKRVGCTAPNGPCETCGRIVSGYMDLADIYAKAADDAQDARPAPLAADEDSAAFKMGLAFEQARAMGEPLSACWEAAYQTAWEHWIGQPAPEPRAAPELAAAMTESRALRAIVAEILGSFGPSGSGHSARVGMVQIAKWRTRAGLTS